MSERARSLGQVGLPVADPDRSEAFYRDVVGLEPLYRYGRLVFFDCGGFKEGTGVRLLLEGSEPPVAPSSGCLYLRVEDIGSSSAALQRRGVAFEHAPHLVAKMPDHDLWMAFFRDPDGHLIALMDEKRRPAGE
jgi:methylmalonyl-CoA/ethylmalonyl-CoA epimerase